MKESAKWMEEARTLDTADRYVNCKCVKYFLRIDQIDKAVETAGLFTRVCVLTSLSLINFFFSLAHTHTHSLLRRVFIHCRRWMRCNVCGFKQRWPWPTGDSTNSVKHLSNFMKLTRL